MKRNPYTYINLSERVLKENYKGLYSLSRKTGKSITRQFSFNLRITVRFFRNIASAKYKQTAGEIYTKVGLAARLSVRRFRSWQGKRRPLYQFEVIFSLESGANKPISLTPQIFRAERFSSRIASIAEAASRGERNKYRARNCFRSIYST